MGDRCKPVPDGFEEFARTHTKNATMEQFRCGPARYERLCAKLGIKRLRGVVRERARAIATPDDFLEMSKSMNNKTLAAHYGFSLQTVARMLAEEGITSRNRTPNAADRAPAGFVETVANLYVTQAVNHYQRSEAVIRRWAKETGARFKQWRGYFTPGPSKVPEADGSLAARAAHHLRRHFPNVYSARILPPSERRRMPDHGNGAYVVGGKGAMSAADMIELAKSKGFDPDAWRSL